MRPAFILIAAFAAAAPAAAADRPQLRPTRDVEVEYRATGVPRGPNAGANAPSNDATAAALTIHFATKGNRLRVEGMNASGYAIIDKDAGRMIMVMTERRTYMEMPREIASDPSVVEGLEATNATFRKIGTDTIAGIGCTTYETSYNARKGKICLTDDGVWLLAANDEPGNRRELKAVKVTYADQPASLFEPPAGFRKVEMPTMPGGMPPRPGSAPQPK